MMQGGGFPIDLILFGMVAAFLVLRLRGVLGRRTGYERPPGDRAGLPVPPVAGPVPAAPATPQRGVPDARGPVGQALARIRGADPNFDPMGFLGGAEGAFRMVVEGFAAGNRQLLHDLLSDETYAGFERAITERESRGEVQRTELREIREAAIEAADLRGTIAEVTVRFVSDQVNMTTDSAGKPVAGTDAVTELTDIWTFQRDVRSPDPAWKLVGTRSA
ncbi:Tim44/TimA family putative adaptor protein [Muricoccus pecuniae]|uniref:Putative lipid-binding transport protein (Tim44 family) n=1 Tax=Muricoccus pecuniae TaxID=693023 RepID=A0A840YI81_9PROT|nr:Tim44/TimA family putative adaptor protein [Roseomonas pecuniae]MBB5694272.1 putative lipid-binding transport protein (Tim44 family) [Roseomonas pecuniae]